MGKSRNENRSKERSPSNLEMTFLGLTWLRGPCTTYAIMKELSLSESTFHRNRAGAAYAIVQRLQALGYIEKVTGSGNIQVTSSGEERLKSWLRPPIDMADIAHSADFIRLRFFFLDMLSPDERTQFIETSISSLRQLLSTSHDLVDANLSLGDAMGALATLSFLHETVARIAWLEQVREMVVSPLDESQDRIRAIACDIVKLADE